MTAHPDPKKVFIAGGGEVRFRKTFNDPLPPKRAAIDAG